jgi:acyl-CoA synthetase (AMP-forming)/AMP-acid ligase II
VLLLYNITIVKRVPTPVLGVLQSAETRFNFNSFLSLPGRSMLIRNYGKQGNPQATKDAFIDGWFCTGDIAVWRNGLPYIVDRKKVGLFRPWSLRPVLITIGTYQVQGLAGCAG